LSRGNDIDVDLSSEFDGMSLDGQHLTLDFIFNNPVMALRGSQASFILRLGTNVPYQGGPGPTWGPMSATLLDQSGNPLGPLEPIFTFPNAGGIILIDRFGNLPYGGILNTTALEVVDGVRFDFDMPDEPGHIIENDQFFRLHSSFDGAGVFIGNLPDNGTTLGLLALGCGMLLLFRRTQTGTTNQWR
jgi:hypothetical protein